MNSTFNYIAGGTLLRRQVVHFYSGLDIFTSAMNDYRRIFVVYFTFFTVCTSVISLSSKIIFNELCGKFFCTAMRK